MTLNRERERLDNLIFLFNNQSFSMSKNSSNNILPLEFPSDEVSSTIAFNFTMRINLSDKRDFPFCNGEIKVSLGINVFIKVKSPWQMSKGFPEVISEYSGESCVMFFLSKSSMRFFIIVILQESLTGSSKGGKGRTMMPPKHPFLPESVETLHRGVSAWFPLRDEYQMYPHEQVETYKLGDTIGVASSASGRHLIVCLGNIGDSHVAPCFNKMPAKGDSLFISMLARVSCMSCHIHRMERIKPDNTFWTSEIAWSHKVCLMEVSHLLGLNVRIWLITAISFGLVSLSLPMTRENIGNSRDRWNMANLSLFKFPMDNLSSDARESRTSGSVRLQLFPDGEYLLNQMVRSFSPDSFWGAALIPETFKSLFFMPMKPFGEPSFTPLKQLEYLIETVSFFIKLYCFTTFFIFILTLHRLSPPKSFGRSLGNVKTGFLCY